MGNTTVLVPLDGSDFSRQVVPVVLRLFDPGRHDLTLLRVAPTPEGIGTPPPRALVLDGWVLGGADAAGGPHPIFQSQVWDALKTDLETRLRPDVETLERAGFPVRTLVRFGDPAEEIVAVAAGEGVDMVVIATHGRSGLRRALMGSVAETVLRRVAIPVMMVRPQPLEVPDTAPS